MNLGTLAPQRKKKERKRIGRGISAGKGKTCGRGMKGQKARSKVRPGFLGGQTPLYKQLPMRRGISNKSHNIGMFRKRSATINVGDLGRFDADTEVTPELLLTERVIKKLHDGLKVLGEGELDKALTVKAHAFSASAREKIEKAGGVAEVIER